MKNKKVVIGVGVAVVILIIGIILTRKPSSVQNVQNGEGKNNAVSQMSLSEIISKNVPQKCEVSYADGATKVSTEMWIKGNKFKQVTIVDTPELGKREMKVVSDGVYAYTWDEATKKGTKMKLEKPEAVDVENAQESVDIDWNTKYDYKCAPSVVMDADLLPPSDVSFTDLEAEINKLQDQMKDINAEGLMQMLPQDMEVTE